MNRYVPFYLLLLITETVEARGRNFEPGPEWFNQLMVGIAAIILLFFLIKKTVSTLKFIFSIFVAMLLLLTVDKLEKNYGPIVFIVVVPILWIAFMKFLELLFKDFGEN